jgi:hypothetical protein
MLFKTKIWASRFVARCACSSRRAIRYITRAVLRTVAGGFAAIPLACGVPPLNMNAEGIREAQYEI